MVNAVQDADSSSVSVNFCITSISAASSGLIKCTDSEGVLYFTRDVYFKHGVLKTIGSFKKQPLTDELIAAFLQAVQSYKAECAAMKYLNRAEHSRFQLEIKLQKKGFLKDEYYIALDYLEEKHFLDDKRFAEAWLHTRLLNKKEGKYRLFSELTARGIAFKTVQRVLDDFFSENPEKELCKKAMTK